MSSFTRFATCLALALAAGRWVRADEQAGAPTISQFVKMRSPTSVDIAKDGTTYFIFDPEGVRQLYTVAPGTMQRDAKKLTDFVDGISSYSLSYDDQWLAITAAEGGNEQTALYLMNVASGELKTLYKDPTKVYGGPLWRRDSKVLAYRANDVSKADFYVYLHDLGSGESQRVFERPGSNAAVDFNSDGTRLVVMKENSAAYSQLFEIDLKSGAIREFTPAGEQWSFDPVGYGPDDKTFVVVSNYRGDRKQLQAIDLAEGKVKLLLTDFADRDVDFATFNRDRTRFALSVNEDGYGTLQIRNYPDCTPFINPPIPRGVVGNVGLKYGKLLYSLSNAKTPAVAYVASPTQMPQPLTEADTQGIDVSKFALPQLIHYKSFDGLEIPAFLYLPPGSEPRPSGSDSGRKPIPFIVQYHGGPEGQYRPVFAGPPQYFLLKGFGIIAPNVRGSSGYGTKYLEMDNYKNRMDSVRDGIWAAKWLIDNGYSKPKMIGAWGGSYGGYMVMATITEAPEIFGAACDVVGIVNMQTFLEQTKDYRRKLREVEYGPLTDAEFLKSISPIYKVDKIDTPLLIAHGLNDPRVPIGEALQIANELRRRHKPVDLLIFPDEGHGFVKEKNRLLYYDTAAAFFERYLHGSTGTE
jgi:dipeptidyl aminopeptidase/acylaminoacyl peptidase